MELLKNRSKSLLEDLSASYGLENTEGWWNKVVVDDLDGDGDPDLLLGNLGENYKFTDSIEDILLAGNRFDTEVQTTPADASPGLFLKGMGNLEFKPLKSFDSGFFVPYNVKDIKTVKNGRDWAILVAVNDDKPRIFTNDKKQVGAENTASR